MSKSNGVKTEGCCFVTKEKTAVKHLENTSDPASAPRFAAVCLGVFNTRAFLIPQIAPVARASVGQSVL